MRSGPLRHFITFQSEVAERDAIGGKVITWFDEVTLPASAEPLQGREYFYAEQVQSEVEIRFRIHYFPGIKPEWRILFEGKPYDTVEIIDNRSLHRELQFLAKSQKDT